MAQWTEDLSTLWTLYYPWRWEGQATYPALRSTDYALQGSYSFKASMTAVVRANSRAEIQAIPAAEYNDEWLGVPSYRKIDGSNENGIFTDKWAIYIPSDYNFDTSDGGWSIITQHKGASGQGRIGQPTIPMYEVSDEGTEGAIYIWTRYSPEPAPYAESVVYHEKIGDPGNPAVATFTKGSWHYFHAEINWDYRLAGGGYVKIYLSKTGWPTTDDIIVDYSGPVGLNDAKGSYFKLGLYKFGWDTQANVDASIAAGCDEVTRYFDMITQANEILAFPGEGEQGDKSKQTLLL